MKIDNGPLMLANGIVLGGLLVGFALGTPVMDWVSENETHVQTIMNTIVSVIGIALVWQQLRHLREQNSVAMSALKLSEQSQEAQQRAMRARAIAALDNLGDLIKDLFRLHDALLSKARSDESDGISMYGRMRIRSFETAVLPVLAEMEDGTKIVEVIDDTRACFEYLSLRYDTGQPLEYTLKSWGPRSPKTDSEAKDLLQRLQGDVSDLIYRRRNQFRT